MAYVDDYTRSVADDYIDQDALRQNNKLLYMLAEWGPPPGMSEGSDLKANIYTEEQAANWTNNTADWTETAEEPVDQATYQYARIQNSVYINGFDSVLNRGVRLSRAVPRDSSGQLTPSGAETLVDLNVEEIAERINKTVKDLNKACYSGSATISPARAGYATKFAGFHSDFGDNTGTAKFGVTRADVSNHDFDKPSTNGTAQPRWETCVLAPATGVVTIFGHGTNSIARWLGALRLGSTNFVGEAINMAEEIHVFMPLDVQNMMMAAQQGSTRNVFDQSMGASPDIHRWRDSFYSTAFGAYFHVDPAAPAGRMLALNSAHNRISFRESGVDPRTPSTFLDDWRIMDNSDNARLPMFVDAGLWSNDLSSIGTVSANITSITL